ncbi:ras-related protein Rab-10-like isoform X4 [Aquila chrysaetos chrysaetos]|uniref:ras-related protein Rab-10-like isoform X4 n=1 Tax=Aquila chrysaetos chrysaetos TaxID=223781 RepID=UPI001177139F|nr:ras-related protein Rab-10-like isoform X4 [Aquila chrysaetos chrysaetos]
MVPGPGPGPAAGPPPPAPHTHPAGGGGARSLTAGRPAALRPPPRPGRHSAPAMAGLGQGCAGKAPLLVKIVMAGESCVGKTSIVRRYTEPGSPPAGAPTSSYLATIGIDFKVKPVTFNGTRVKLQIWDTAGQERFHTLSTSYFRGAQGFVLVYDITNLDSFRSITSWMKDIHEKAGDEVDVILLGNKCDKESERVVPKQKGEKPDYEELFWQPVHCDLHCL